MEAQNWHEVESIELTQWVKRVSKLTKSLPPSATKPIAGKSITEVLFGSSSLRHSAVHRLPTSAAGILNMLSAAVEFAEALKDFTRAEKVAEIKARLEPSIEGIVQHQNLLQRKLTDQLEDIARRRVELDNLEESAVKEMLAADKQQRTDTGSILEDFLASSQQVSNPCVQVSTPSFDGPKAGSEAGENSETSGIGVFASNPLLSLPVQPIEVLMVYLGHEYESPHGLDEDPAHSTKAFGEEKPVQNKELKKDNGGVFEEEPVLEMTLPTPILGDVPVDASPTLTHFTRGKYSKRPRNNSLECDALPDPTLTHFTRGKDPKRPRNNSLERDALPDDPDHMAQEAISVEEICFTESKEALRSEDPCIRAPEEIPDEIPLAEDTSRAYDANPSDNFMIAEEAIPCAEPEASPAEPEDSPAEPEASPAEPEASPAEQAIQDWDEAEKASFFNRYGENSNDLDDLYESTPEFKASTAHDSNPPEELELSVSLSEPSVGTERYDTFRHPAPPSTEIETVVAPENGHTIVLKILHDSQVLRSVVLIRACTRTAILDEARNYCMKCEEDYPSVLLAKGWDLAIQSLRMDECDIDMSTYQVEDLSFLLRTVEKSGIPMFTLRLFEL